jgi:hypothetical protein
MNNFASVFAYSQYSIWNIPSMLNIVDCFRAMLFATQVSSKLKDLNYDNFHIENARYILTIFNGDILFELPPIVSPDGHSK